MVWIVFDLILKKKVPAMYPADALLFLAGAPMIAGFLLRPHRQPTRAQRTARPLDFSLLSVVVALPICFVRGLLAVHLAERSWIQPQLRLAFGHGNLLLASVLLVFWRDSSGPWKTFYGWFGGAVAFNGIWFYVLNHAIENDVYFTGSWYDIPYSGSFALFTAVGLMGTG